MRFITAIMSVAAALLQFSPILAAETIKIGVSMPTTGAVAYGALQERHGLELALKELNASGGVLGRQIELVFEDNQCNPSVAVTVTNKLFEAQVPAVIGAQCSSAVLATMPLFQKAGIPLVSGIATSPAISERAGVGGNPWVFRLNPSDRELAVANAKYLKSLGTVQKVAILAESTDYGRGGADAFSAAAKNIGLEVVSTDIYAIGSPDFTTIITRLRRTGAQAVIVYQAPADNINFAQQALSQGLKIFMSGKIGFEGKAVEQLIEAGAYAGASTAYPYSPSIDTPVNREFALKVAKAYDGSKPTYETFAGYEELYVLAAAIKRAGSIEPKAIRDALVTTSYMSMIGGTVEFDDHNQAHNSAAVLVIDGTKVVVKDVFPTK